MDNPILEKLNINTVRKASYTGKGIKIAVIDDGVNSYSGKLEVAGGYNFVENNNSNYGDSNGHGTKVASIIKSKEFGIAYDSSIYSLKIDVKYEQSTIDRLIKAIDWCIHNKMDIINISFGFTGYKDSELEKKCREAVENGIVIVCAAGNNYMSQGLSIPASYNSTIAISSVKEDNTISETSSYGKAVDFCCYGEKILAYDVKGNITNVSGTSFAAPCAAGIIALIKEQNRSLTPREIYELLKENALQIDKGRKKSLYYGYGLLKAFILPDEYKKEKELIIDDLRRNIYFPYTKLRIELAETVDSNINFLPANDEPSSVDYTIGDDNIAIVDSDGFVTGRKAGITSLIAVMDNSKAAVSDIEVYSNDTPKPTADILNLNGLNIPELHKAGIKGKGIKIGYVGYGCIDSNNINLKQRVNIAEDTSTKDANNYGTIYCSIISGKTIGIAPEADLYAVKCAAQGGIITWNDAQKAIQWCIDNKMDIINFSYTNANSEVTKNLLQKCYDNNIIVIANVCDKLSGPTFIQKSDYTLTVSYVTDKKEFLDGDIEKTPFKGSFVDCVSYGYGVQCINHQDAQFVYGVGEAPVAQYYCNIAMAEVMGICALLKQQDSSINNAVKIRALLPQLCEALYGGKNNKTGYGLLKAGFIKK